MINPTIKPVFDAEGDIAGCTLVNGFVISCKEVVPPVVVGDVVDVPVVVPVVPVVEELVVVSVVPVVLIEVVLVVDVVDDDDVVVIAAVVVEDNVGTFCCCRVNVKLINPNVFLGSVTFTS